MEAQLTTITCLMYFVTNKAKTLKLWISSLTHEQIGLGQTDICFNSSCGHLLTFLFHERATRFVSLCCVLFTILCLSVHACETGKSWLYILFNYANMFWSPMVTLITRHTYTHIHIYIHIRMCIHICTDTRTHSHLGTPSLTVKA